MTELALSKQAQADEHAIDDCWNRIGIRGDKSCPELVRHIHCRNCAVYAAAATRLLDRYALQHSIAVYEHTVEEVVQATQSLVIFRLGEEWLALATRTLVEISPLAPIHSLPHQRSRALLGVANVRGALVPCVSLIELLGLEATQVSSPGRVLPRLLILAGQGGNVVMQVDEVEGIHAIEEQVFHGAASTGGIKAGSGKYTRGVIQWRERSVRVLDEEQLLQAVMRSLT